MQHIRTAAAQKKYFVPLGKKVSYRIFKICCTICLLFPQNSVHFLVSFGAYHIHVERKYTLKFKYPLLTLTVQKPVTMKELCGHTKLENPEGIFGHTVF